ncbi:MAG TPA: Dabb family protein [Planctomycetaceae bacterium]|nr:Dabb family protein [Planctomycetaceae bacterium]
MKSLTLMTLLMTAFAPLASHAEDQIVPLKTGDRIVFLGDSITQQGAGPNGYVTFVRNTLNRRVKDLGIEVIGAGISGHKVPDLQKRLDKDVLDKNPTIVVIYIGINDVWHSQNGRGTSTADYESGLKDLIARILANNARVILCTPSVIGEKHAGENPLDGMLAEYAGISRKVAYDADVQLLDLHDAFRHQIERINSDNKEKGILTTDGVHLNEAGNRFVSRQVLTALGVPPVPQKLLRHVVLFKFTAETTAEEVQEVVDAFAALPDKIDTIVGFEAGTDVSVENKSEGFTHGFVVSFRDEKGRDTYLPHPAHQEFVKLVGPRLEKVLVFDYYAR